MVISLDQQLVKQIEDICSARGVRLTTQRKRVFELICASAKASSAYELLEELKQSEGIFIDLTFVTLVHS